MSIKATVDGTAYTGITTINAGGKAITLAETGTIATPTATKTQSITENGTISVDVTNYKTITITTNVQSSSGGSSDSGSDTGGGSSSGTDTGATDTIELTKLSGHFISNGIITANSNCSMAYGACESNSTYTVTRGTTDRFVIGYTTEAPSAGVTVSGVSTPTGSTGTVSTGSNAAYIVVYFYFNGSVNSTDQLATISVTKN